MKKNGGIIINWQFHTLSASIEEAKKIRPDLNIKVDKLMVLTGIVKEDPTGRWRSGYHMRSSLIVDYNETTNVLETENTIYQLEGEPNDPYLEGDVGDKVLNIFY